mmetsp:Transcript_32202/g.75009  ORF Transcript_32202/g.75009 Transcript_32202/m.75009 type:complete len:215 (+) Transcript_32202:1762-2406(+)
MNESELSVTDSSPLTSPPSVSTMTRRIRTMLSRQLVRPQCSTPLGRWNTASAQTITSSAVLSKRSPHMSSSISSCRLMADGATSSPPGLSSKPLPMIVLANCWTGGAATTRWNMRSSGRPGMRKRLSLRAGPPLLCVLSLTVETASNHAAPTCGALGHSNEWMWCWPRRRAPPGFLIVKPSPCSAMPTRSAKTSKCSIAGIDDLTSSSESYTSR